MKTNRNVWRTVGYVSVGFALCMAITLFAACLWIKSTFNVGIQEILFTIKSPLKGTESGVVEDALKTCLPPIVIGMLLYIIGVAVDVKLKVEAFIKVKIQDFTYSFALLKFIRIMVAVLIFIMLVISIAYVTVQCQIIDYIKSRADSTTIYEDYYVHPDSVNITADGDEKNLILIYLESMETTYASVEDGGNQSVSYIPELIRIANENVSFSDGDELGGFIAPSGASWTVGALMATSSGIPFSFPIEGNSANMYEEFATGLTNLGDILDEFGYNQVFACGSDADFGGRRKYFEQHGNYNIMDLQASRDKGYIPQDYSVWWGFEDIRLFDIAKKEITILADKNEPFNFTMLTVDAHHVGGYVCDSCEKTYESDTANVIACTDKQVGEFVNWCKEQPFYDNTAIIIIGDHPRMDTYLVEGVDRIDRTMYNCFINCGEHENLNTQNRVFTSMDIFPTILSAIDFEYDGNRIGLGTNMFSNERTLAEQLGYEQFNSETSKYSKFYLDKFS